MWGYDSLFAKAFGTPHVARVWEPCCCRNNMMWKKGCPRGALASCMRTGGPLGTCGSSARQSASATAVLGWWAYRDSEQAHQRHERAGKGKAFLEGGREAVSTLCCDPAQRHTAGSMEAQRCTVRMWPRWSCSMLDLSCSLKPESEAGGKEWDGPLGLALQKGGNWGRPQVIGYRCVRGVREKPVPCLVCWIH